MDSVETNADADAAAAEPEASTVASVAVVICRNIINVEIDCLLQTPTMSLCIVSWPHLSFFLLHCLPLWHIQANLGGRGDGSGGHFFLL